MKPYILNIIKKQPIGDIIARIKRFKSKEWEAKYVHERINPNIKIVKGIVNIIIIKICQVFLKINIKE